MYPPACSDKEILKVGTPNILGVDCLGTRTFIKGLLVLQNIVSAKSFVRLKIRRE